jgi:membrane protease YdiL (CAAX protease family)
MTWIFNGSGESLPIAMIAHASINTFASLALPQMFPSLSSQQDVTDASLLVPAAAAAALVLLVATRGRLGYCPGPGPQPGSRPTRPAVPA